MESTKFMRWLWGEDQGGRIYLYEPQREGLQTSYCLYPAARRLVLSESKQLLKSPLLCGC